MHSVEAVCVPLGEIQAFRCATEMYVNAVGAWRKVG